MRPRQFSGLICEVCSAYHEYAAIDFIFPDAAIREHEIPIIDPAIVIGCRALPNRPTSAFHISSTKHINVTQMAEKTKALFGSLEILNLLLHLSSF